MKVVSTKLSKPEWSKLVEKCNEKGITLAEYFRELIRKDRDDEQSARDVHENEESDLPKMLDALSENNNVRLHMSLDWDNLESPAQPYIGKMPPKGVVVNEQSAEVYL